jgi:alkylated DNA repair dioxygenase AlkB
MAGPPLTWQPSLFNGADERGAAVDPGFTGIVRHRLDATAWLDECRGWVSGADALFAWLVDNLAWQAVDVEMYGRIVPQPRLVARMDTSPASAPLPPALEAMRAALSARYGRDFDSCGVNLYRDGRDSVAWHGDRIARVIVDPLVAIVTLGEARRFLLRPCGGVTKLRLEPQAGDLLVMGGSSQRTWQHSVPKAVSAGPRMSVTFRHSR